MQFYYPQKNQGQAEMLYENYIAEGIFTDLDRKPVSLIPKKDRVCRFCKRKYPLVTFRNDAHIIPELLGNRNLVSDFECDDCNYKFGKYDDQFAKFLGISRTLESVSGKKGIPTFKSGNNNLRAGKSSDIPGIEILSTDNSNNPFDIDFATGIGSITFKKQAYRPLYVFKSLLKMALACVNDTDVPDYQNAIKYILTDKLDDKLLGANRVQAFRTLIRESWESPFAILFRKRDQQNKIPTHLFVLFTKSSVFQIIVPLHSKDLRFYGDGNIQVCRCPPLFPDQTVAETVQIQEAEFDLSSKELCRDDVEKIILQMAKEDLGRLVRFDPQTRQFDNSGELPKVITKMNLVQSGFTMNVADS